VTTPARTLLDLASVLTRRAIDQAERRRLLDTEALETVLDAHPTRKGTRLLRSVLADHAIGSTLTINDLEELMFGICRSHSLPSPEVNAYVGSYKVDFLWRNQKVIVETDGRESHGTRAAFEKDRARDARLTAQGYRVLRFTYHRQVVKDPAKAASLIAAVLNG
jgi:very-short-patch-repair endonuclease